MTSSREIASRVEAARRAQQRSVSWLCDKTGFAEKTYRRRVAAPEQFTMGELSRIAGALGVELEEFFVDHAQAVA